jgi:hypothetical protein
MKGGESFSNRENYLTVSENTKLSGFVSNGKMSVTVLPDGTLAAGGNTLIECSMLKWEGSSPSIWVESSEDDIKPGSRDVRVKLYPKHLWEGASEDSDDVCMARIIWQPYPEYLDEFNRVFGSVESTHAVEYVRNKPPEIDVQAPTGNFDSDRLDKIKDYCAKTDNLISHGRVIVAGPITINSQNMHIVVADYSQFMENTAKKSPSAVAHEIVNDVISAAGNGRDPDAELLARDSIVAAILEDVSAVIMNSYSRQNSKTLHYAVELFSLISSVYGSNISSNNVQLATFLAAAGDIANNAKKEMTAKLNELYSKWHYDGRPAADTSASHTGGVDHAKVDEYYRSIGYSGWFSVVAVADVDHVAMAVKSMAGRVGDYVPREAAGKIGYSGSVIEMLKHYGGRPTIRVDRYSFDQHLTNKGFHSPTADVTFTVSSLKQKLLTMVNSAYKIHFIDGVGGANIKKRILAGSGISKDKADYFTSDTEHSVNIKDDIRNHKKELETVRKKRAAAEDKLSYLAGNGDGAIKQGVYNKLPSFVRKLLMKQIKADLGIDNDPRIHRPSVSGRIDPKTGKLT